MRAVLPSRSPTTGFIWQRTTLSCATGPAYAGGPPRPPGRSSARRCHTGPVATGLAEYVGSSADPAFVDTLLQRLEAAQPASSDVLAADADLLARMVTVGAASPDLARLCITDPD